MREVHEWDGKFARIERGAGQVTVTRLDDRAVEIEVSAQAPVLVALGTGYYPRWRATHASGVDEPVYALPAVDGGTVHVVSAWVAPGKTTFTCDGPLPSDGDGRVLSLLAALLALAGVVAWSRAPWRVRVLRVIAALRARGGRHAVRALELAVPAVLAVLCVRGFLTDHGRTPALLVGGGLRPIATVEARVGDGAWQSCDYVTLSASYRCEDVVAVADATINMLNDAPPSWPFITPAIVATALTDNVELRITRRARLAGRYWVGASAGVVALEAAGESAPRQFAARATFDYDDEGARDVRLTARVPDLATLYISVVAEDTLEPARPFLAPPPASAPAALAGVGLRD